MSVSCNMIGFFIVVVVVVVVVAVLSLFNID